MVWTKIGHGDYATSQKINELYDDVKGDITTISISLSTFDSKIQTAVNNSYNKTKKDLDDAKTELIGVFNELPSSGNINLETNTINTITPTDAVTFVLPDVSAGNSMHQILVQVKLNDVISINVGTKVFFNGKTPNLSTAGLYNLIFEYDEANSVWVCGWMRKS